MIIVEELLNIDLPKFKATYNVKWIEGTDFDSLKNVKQANGVIFNDEGNILIINIVGNWQLPGGHIEKGESYEDGLIREIDEEADAEIKDITPIGNLRVAEIKDGKIKPEIVQLYYFGRIERLKRQTIDPAFNKIGKRKFIEPEEFTNYIPWGNTGKKIIQKAKEVFSEKIKLVSNIKEIKLEFMEPLKDFKGFKKEIDIFIDEVHPP